MEKELKEEIVDAMMTYATFIALNFTLDLYGREGMVMWAIARIKPVVIRKQKEVQLDKKIEA